MVELLTRLVKTSRECQCQSTPYADDKSERSGFYDLESAVDAHCQTRRCKRRFASVALQAGMIVFDALFLGILVVVLIEACVGKSTVDVLEALGRYWAAMGESIWQCLAGQGSV